MFLVSVLSFIQNSINHFDAVPEEDTTLEVALIHGKAI
jgi:hypothetical protein